MKRTTSIISFYGFYSQILENGLNYLNKTNLGH